MQFDELCALVGALRDRVAELEAKAAAEGCAMQINLSGADGSPDIAAIVEKAVASAIARSLKATGGMAAPGHYRIGERGPETITPVDPDRAAQVRDPAAAQVAYDPFAITMRAVWPKF